MREVFPRQKQLDEVDISEIRFNPKSRDDIPQILKGLQYLYITPHTQEALFKALDEITPAGLDRNNGRPGMNLWRIFVMATLRVNLNIDYDRLHHMTNSDQLLRQMLGHGLFDEYEYHIQTIKDNLKLFTPELLDKINQIVLEAGHGLLKKKEGNLTLRGRCDSFVVETDVHYPTDINLLLDAMRKVITLTTKQCEKHELTDWRQYAYNNRQVKRAYRKAQQRKRSRSKDINKQEKREKEIAKAHQDYIYLSASYLTKANATIEKVQQQANFNPLALEEITHFIAHAERQIDQIRRRVIHREIIPHEEKVFSIFQPHTEWISKGKAGVPVEFGLKVCVLEDQYGFILHHQVMQKQTDDQVAIPMIEATQKRFPMLHVCSFDKGFHSRRNQTELREQLDRLVLPKKGRLTQEEKALEDDKEFIKTRHQHSAIESAINALEVHGLDRCLDHGIVGFNRYVSLAIVARNIQQLGALLRKKEKREQEKHLKRKKAA